MRNAWSRNVVGGVALVVISAVSLTLPELGPAISAASPPAPEASAASLARDAPGRDTSDVRACGPLPRFARDTAAQIMAGRLTISPFKAVTIDPGKNGDIDWFMNPYDDPTWVLDF